MSRHSLFAAATLFLLASGTEAATPPEASEPPSQSVETPQPDTSGYLKSQNTGKPEFQNANLPYPGKSLFNAYGWMLLGTVIPLAASTAIPVDGPAHDAHAATKSLLLLGGLLIGPSAGQVYAGSYSRSALAFAVRTTGFAMVLRAWSMSQPVYCGDCEQPDDRYAGAWIVGGFVVYLGGVVYSMYDQEKAVERYNAKLRADGAFGWTPTLVPGPEGSLRTGATAWMRF